MAMALLTTPLVTDSAIEGAGDALVEVWRALAAEMLKDLGWIIETGLEHDLNSLHALAPTNAKAAVRATATILVAAHLDRTPALLLHAAALMTAVFEGLRCGSPVPGRVESLARRADEAARSAGQNEALQLPWYVESAAGAASVASFAAWNPANRISLRRVRQPTREDLESWERVKADIDSARPHRQLFASS
ncbi:MAG: hypothetical protein GQE15_27505 [Archangiaceae bacterium]|nr:hypothetical protein [Archangiaceae bacterium]